MADDHKETVDNQRAALYRDLHARLKEGKCNSGELSAIMREIDFLDALKDVLAKE